MISATQATSFEKPHTPHVPEGLHILSNFTSPLVEKLFDYNLFEKFIDEEINKLKIVKVGEAYYNFEGGGFTAVLCLAESHLSIHTWPDRNYVTFDVFLSNYTKDNRPSTESIYKEVLAFFEAKILFENHIQR